MSQNPPPMLAPMTDCSRRLTHDHPVARTLLVSSQPVSLRLVSQLISHQSPSDHHHYPIDLSYGSNTSSHASRTASFLQSDLSATTRSTFHTLQGSLSVTTTTTIRRNMILYEIPKRSPTPSATPQLAYSPTFASASTPHLAPTPGHPPNS